MTNEEKISLTDGEMRILKAIFANMNGKPDVDWDAAASAASLGNANPSKVVKRSGGGRKKKATAEEEEEDEERDEKPAAAVEELDDGEF
ncbi:hypothetical protein LLEC1_03664 [Akanthomyces lecanii]|uniref:Uncharacterized protein n=1 Tax=Cordyceps confragosa TaxID=2714763 RepID=A0A179IB39_CORDF|nr:hypothetical protein LLEC1_03664 [Akanthomyces lecanii]